MLFRSAQACGAGFGGLDCALIVEMDIGHDRHARRLHDLAQHRGRFFIRTGDAHNVDPGLFRAVADLAGKSACVGSGTIYESWLKGEFVNQTAVAVSAQPPTGITVTSQETDNLCIEALAAGRSWDFFVQGKEFIQNAIDKGAKIKFLDNKWITAEQISIALDKAGLPTASMLAALNKIVADAHADGTLTAISKKWLNGVDVTVKQ